MPSGIIAEHQQVEGQTVICGLCPHHCRLREGQSGRCHVYQVRNGRLMAAAYGMVSSVRIDPIEKKPLYHYHPGSAILSIGGWGCNLACDFCQNWSISQTFAGDEESAAPEAILDAVQRSGSPQVAYTYNEPLVNFEFVRDCARLMRDNGCRNVLVTNGFVESAPADELLELTEAINLDIKSMDDGFYRRRCRGSLAPVLQFARQARAAGCHLEITHLLVPEPQARPDGVDQLAEWIAANLGPETPLHISAYHPQYRSDTPATSLPLLLEAHATAATRLEFVYLGNVTSGVGRDTRCPQCGREWIKRDGAYGAVSVTGVTEGCCAGCGAPAALRL